MQQVTTSTDRTRGLIDSIASHLRHPGFGGVSGDAGEGNAARLQVEKEEDVIGDETAPGQDLNGEEVCSGKDGHVSGDEVLPIRALATFRRWRDAITYASNRAQLLFCITNQYGSVEHRPSRTSFLATRVLVR